MIARHIKQWNIQHRQQVFKVRIRQVSTAENQLDLAKVTTRTQIVKTIDNLIAYCKNFHNRRIVPQNGIPCKGRQQLTSRTGPGTSSRSVQGPQPLKKFCELRGETPFAYPCKHIVRGLNLN